MADCKNSEVGLRIQGMRLKIGYSQGEVARNIDVARQTVSNWENGSNMPNVMQLKRLASFFHCTTDYILFGCRADELKEKKLQLKEAEKRLKEYEDKKRKRENIKNILFRIFFPITPLIIFIGEVFLFSWIYTLFEKMEYVYGINLSLILAPMNFINGTSGIIFGGAGVLANLIAGIVVTKDVLKNNKNKNNKKEISNEEDCKSVSDDPVSGGDCWN